MTRLTRLTRLTDSYAHARIYIIYYIYYPFNIKIIIYYNFYIVSPLPYNVTTANLWHFRKLEVNLVNLVNQKHQVNLVNLVNLFCMRNFRNFRNLFLISLHQISALVCTRGVTKRDTPWGVVTADTPQKNFVFSLNIL